MKVRDAMSTDVETIHPAETIKETARRMRVHGIGYFPVTDRGRLLGIITDRDIACRAVADDCDPNLTKVREIMTMGVAYCRDDEDLDTAVQLMEQNRVRRLPVLDRKDELVGVLSVSDIARQAPQRLTAEVLEAVSRDLPLSVTIHPKD